MLPRNASATSAANGEAASSGNPRPLTELKRIPRPPLTAEDLVSRASRPSNFVPAEGLPLEEELFTGEDHPYNRKGFRYILCKPFPLLSHVLYVNQEMPPFCARASFEDASQFVGISKDGLRVSVSPSTGFRSVRANVPIREGSWFFEVKVLHGLGPDAHVRLGIMRREASLQTPVGYDAYGYGFRDINGQKFHISRPQDFMNESFGPGDVIGVHVYCPPRTTSPSSRKVSGIDLHTIHRDRIPIKYKGIHYFEALDYIPTKEIDDLLYPTEAYRKSAAKKANDGPLLEGSYIDVYKNGEYMGRAFENLRDFWPPNSHFQSGIGACDLDDGEAGYFPAISVFKGGHAEFNFGPEFMSLSKDELIEKKIRPLSEKYDELIAEQAVLDVIDQVDIEMTEPDLNERARKELVLDSGSGSASKKGTPSVEPTSQAAQAPAPPSSADAAPVSMSDSLPQPMPTVSSEVATEGISSGDSKQAAVKEETGDLSSQATSQNPSPVDNSAALKESSELGGHDPDHVAAEPSVGVPKRELQRENTASEDDSKRLKTENSDERV